MVFYDGMINTFAELIIVVQILYFISLLTMNNFRLKSNNKQLFHKETSYQERDDTSGYVDKVLQTVSRDLSADHENCSTVDSPLCRINNIYMVIGNFNDSVVKVGESSYRNDSETNKNKKSQCKTIKASECNTSEAYSTKIRMAEYFDKAGNTGKSTHNLNLSTKQMQTTENNLEITYHYPSKTKV